MVDQSVFPVVDEQELANMDKEIQDLTADHQKEASALKNVEAQLKQSSGSITTEEAKSQLQNVSTDPIYFTFI